MKTVETELGMKVKVTPLIASADELVALYDDLTELKDKIEKQERIVMQGMKDKKQYEIRIGGYVLKYLLKEEEEKIKKAKDKEYAGGL